MLGKMPILTKEKWKKFPSGPLDCLNVQKLLISFIKTSSESYAIRNTIIIILKSMRILVKKIWNKTLNNRNSWNHFLYSFLKLSFIV